MYWPYKPSGEILYEEKAEVPFGLGGGVSSLFLLSTLMGIIALFNNYENPIDFIYYLFMIPMLFTIVILIAHFLHHKFLSLKEVEYKIRTKGMRYIGDGTFCM